MNKFIEYKFKSNKKYSKTNEEILKNIIQSKKEMVAAIKYFQLVKDPMLIDYAIYTEKAARAKYMYFLNEAKKKNIKIEYSCMLKKVNAV